MTHATTPARRDTQHAHASPEELRARVQHARIAARLPIADLAAHVKCTPDTLAAFEAGHRVLEPDLEARLRKRLKL